MHRSNGSIGGPANPVTQHFWPDFYAVNSSCAQPQPPPPPPPPPPPTYTLAAARAITSPASDTSVRGPQYSFVIKKAFSCQTSGLVYCISCRHCPVYIGETGRTLRQRFDEHLRSIEKNLPGFPEAEHFNTVFLCNSARILIKTSRRNDMHQFMGLVLI